MTVVSGNIRFIWIFVGFLRDEESNDSGVIENVDFRAFGRYVFGTFGNEANINININTHPKMRDLE